MKKILIWKNKIWESRRLNIGYQFILKEMIFNLKKLDRHIEIYLFSDNCRITQERYDVIPVSIFNPIAVLCSILKADLILFGGGTVLSDKSSLLALIVQISVIIFAILFKKKVIGFAIGVDSLSPTGKMIVRPFLNRINLITVRDIASKKRLEKMNILEPPIIVTADAAFAFDGKIHKSEQSYILKREHITTSGRMLIGISPRRIFHYSKNILPYNFRRMVGLIPDHVSDKLVVYF